MPKWFERFLKRAVDSGPADQILGKNVLLELASTKGLGASIGRDLSSLEGWPFDLGGGTPNPEEQAIMSLWGFSAAVLHGITAGTDADKRAFLDRFHDLYFCCLVDGGLAPAAVKKLSILAGERYPQYEAAFTQMRRGEPVPWASLARIVTFHLFGHETNDLSVCTTIGICTKNHFTSFDAVFDTTKAWATMRGLIP